MYDCLVVGKGPAGITCAIYLKRFNLNPLVIGKDNGSLGKSPLIENYYGIKSISGDDLIELGVEQAKRLGIEVVSDEVLDISSNSVTTTKQNYEGKCVFLALGKERKTIKNASFYEGKGLSYCAICDGFFYKNKKIGLVGSGSFMEKEKEILLRFTKDISIFKEDDVSLYGEDHLEGIETKDGKFPLDGVFIATGANGFSLAKHLGLELSNGSLVVHNYMTNMDGVFAGGDVIGGLTQITKASYDGMNAAMAIKDYLLKTQK